jgi:fatty acid desaturase
MQAAWLCRSVTTALFKYHDGVVPNSIAIGYVLVGHGVGLALLFWHDAAANVAGVLLVTHTLALSAYLIHECIHETIFGFPRDNFLLASLLASINGGSVAGYEALRKKHLHHHSARNDPVGFDYRGFLHDCPAAIRGGVIALEWAHFPAIELVLRVEAFVRPFTDPARASERTRMSRIVVVRLALATLVAAVSVRALALYALAYLLFVVLMRFFDAFHHTFEQVVVDDYDHPIPVPAEKDRAYEDVNTYSNLVSRRYPLLNLLILNFAFHNAHHAKPGIPWHRLPALHERLYGDELEQVIPARELVRNFHRYRLSRIFGEDTASDGRNRPRIPVYLGAVGVSLLTL